MKISYDPKVDALSITFRETTVTTKHLAEGIAADYDSEGRLAGLEILDAQKRFGGSETMRHVELEGVGHEPFSSIFSSRRSLARRRIRICLFYLSAFPFLAFTFPVPSYFPRS